MKISAFFEACLVVVCAFGFYAIKVLLAVSKSLRRMLELIIAFSLILGALLLMRLLPHPFELMGTRFFVYGAGIWFMSCIILFCWREVRFINLWMKVFYKEP